MLDRAFRVTLRDFTTYFLIAAAIFVPLHVVYSFLWQDVIAVSALHDQISQLPGDDTVRGVGAGDIATFRLVGAFLLLAQALATPLIAAAALHVIRTRDVGELPSVRGALAAAPGLMPKIAQAIRAPGPLVVALVVALAIGLTARVAGLMLLEPISDRMLWAGVALAEGGARSLAAPFVTVPAAFISRRG